MGTRSTITLIGTFNRVNLYRHWDGYPAFTGRHLAHAVRNATAIEGVVAKLLTEGDSEIHGAGRYEFTGEPEMHGDREWHYEITVRYQKPALIRVEEYDFNDNKTVAFEGELPEYRQWIKKHLVALIRRHKARMAA